ncbi:ATP-binding protein [Actinoplanes sp. NPDC051851]|uniref:NACHT domain-containing protein n=1 Tax=Actinoplanes sp. NPDC051851 TaxID=3154753 RepID=UPI00343839A9
MAKAQRKTENEIGFKAVRRIVESVEPGGGAVEVVDRLFSAVLILSPVVLGPIAAIPLLALFDMKSDLIRQATDLAHRLAGTKGDFLDRSRSLAAAHWLITYSAYFEAWKSIAGVAPPAAVIDAARSHVAEHHPGSGPDVRPVDSAQPRALSDSDYAALPPVSLPHPASSFRTEAEDRLDLYTRMMHVHRNLQMFLADTPSNLSVPQWNGLPAAAVEYYHAQYLDLLLEYRDFFGYALLYEFQKTQELGIALAAETGAEIQRVQHALSGIDQGLTNLAAALTVLTDVDPAETEARRVADALQRHYQSEIEKPVIVDEDPGDGPRLVFPAREHAFVPQSFKAVEYDRENLRLEHEQTWAGAPERGDLGGFLVHYLQSDRSVDQPLVLLGHPGSGKSLLTQVLAARLMPPVFTVVRIELRFIDPDTDLQTQIEDQIRRDTGRRVDWADFADQLRSEPPLIILDGYDELLQATGQVHASYLTNVRRFQERERVQRRPVRVIITSRITLIDKATVPLGATVIRLLEFDEDRRRKWAEIWNTANRGYFAETGVRPFEVPASARLSPLAEQPLLLLMLALYDSSANELAGSGIDRTELYYNLLTRFVRREHEKHGTARDGADLQAAVDADMRRLGVVAIGMVNRFSVSARREEIGADLAYFKAERASGAPTTGALLSPADLLLGSFFFMHHSQGQTGDPDGPSAGISSSFEFLHNTFGEFLAADFIVSGLVEAAGIAVDLDGRERLRPKLDEHLAKPSEDWCATYAFAPLHGRPVIVDMVRSWLPHRCRRAGLAPETVAAAVRRIIDRQLLDIATNRPSTWFYEGIDTAPNETRSLLYHLATYTLNLVVIGAVATSAPYRLPVSGDHWGTLAHLWRGAFTEVSLLAASAILATKVTDDRVSMMSRPLFATPGSGSPLETRATVAKLLGDHLGEGTSILALAEFAPIVADDIEVAKSALSKGGVALADLLDARISKQRISADSPNGLPSVRTYPGFANSLRNFKIGVGLHILELFDVEQASEEAIEAFGGIGPEKVEDFLQLPIYYAKRVLSVKGRLEPRWIDDLSRKLAMLVDGDRLGDFAILADVLRLGRVQQVQARRGIGLLLAALWRRAETLSADVAAELLISSDSAEGRVVADGLFARSLGSYEELRVLPEESMIRLILLLAEPDRFPQSAASMTAVVERYVGYRWDRRHERDAPPTLALAVHGLLDTPPGSGWLRMEIAGGRQGLQYILAFVRIARLRGSFSPPSHRDMLSFQDILSSLRAESIDDLEDRLTSRQLDDLRWLRTVTRSAE